MGRAGCAVRMPGSRGVNGIIEASVIVLAVLLGAAAQTATGFGLGLIAVPLLSLVMPPGRAVALSLLLPLPLNIWILVEGGLPRSRVNLLRLLVAGIVALPAGVYLVKVLPPSVLRIAIGSLTLVLTTLVMSGRRVLARQSPLVDSLVGAISGVASGATGMGGPLVGIVLLGRIADKASYRAVMLLYLLVLNICSFLFLAILTPALAGIVPSLMFSLPALVVGLAVGGFAFLRIGELGRRRFVLGLASAAGAVSFAYGLVQLASSSAG
jgi:uncharacterized protein